MTIQAESRPVQANAPLATQGGATEPPRTLHLNRAVKAVLALRRSRARSPGFHPSEMERLCPVLETLIEEANENIASGHPDFVKAGLGFRRAVLESRRFDAELEMEFAVGDAIHEATQFQLGLAGVNWGVWECPSCHARTLEGWMPRTTVPDVEGRDLLDAAPCRACLGRNLREDIAWKYVETNIGEAPRAKAYELTGNMDLDLRVQHDGKWFRLVGEIKSINEAGFTGKRGPLPKEEHIAQASLYGWVLGVDYICFIYVDKNQVNHWKEIIVPVNMAAVQAALAKIEAVRGARPTKVLPVHARACCDIREKRAQTCPGVERCFGQRPPDNFMAKK